MMALGSGRGLAAIALVCALLLSGCARIGAMSRVDPLSIAVYPGGASFGETLPTGDCPLVSSTGSFSYGAVDLDCFVFPEDRPQPENLSTATEGRLAYRRAAEGATERNRLTALLLKHSDDVCVEEMGRLTGNEATVNASLNILGTGATAAANIVSGELAQQILTGVGTFAGASRSHIRTDIYRNTFSYAISRAIDRERQRLRELSKAVLGDTPSNLRRRHAIGSPTKSRHRSFSKDGTRAGVVGAISAAGRPSPSGPDR